MTSCVTALLANPEAIIVKPRADGGGKGCVPHKIEKISKKKSDIVDGELSHKGRGGGRIFANFVASFWKYFSSWVFQERKWEMPVLHVQDAGK